MPGAGAGIPRRDWRAATRAACNPSSRSGAGCRSADWPRTTWRRSATPHHAPVPPTAEPHVPLPKPWFWNVSVCRGWRRYENGNFRLLRAASLRSLRARIYPLCRGSGARGHSSVGRALQWHCRGRRFDSDWLHQLAARFPGAVARRAAASGNLGRPWFDRTLVGGAIPHRTHYCEGAIMSEDSVFARGNVAVITGCGERHRSCRGRTFYGAGHAARPLRPRRGTAR